MLHKHYNHPALTVTKSTWTQRSSGAAKRKHVCQVLRDVSFVQFNLEVDTRSESKLFAEATTPNQPHIHNMALL